MSEKLESARKEIKKFIPPLLLGLGISLILGISEFYNLFSQGNFSGSQIVGPILSVVATAIGFFVLYLLKKESKHALTVFLFELGLGLTRAIFVDKAFEFNLASVILMFIFAWFILRFFKWIKVGALR